MARLKRLGQPLGALRPTGRRLDAGEAERSARRDATEAWRKWYKTARWQRLRWQVLTEAGFECAMCGRVEGAKGRMVCDHVRPHRGDEALFWAGPFQALCKCCHDGDKQRAEAADRRAGRG